MMTCLALSVASSLGNAIAKYLVGSAKLMRLFLPAAVQAEGVPLTKMTGMMKIMTGFNPKITTAELAELWTTTRFWEYPESNPMRN